MGEEEEENEVNQFDLFGGFHISINNQEIAIEHIPNLEDLEKSMVQPAFDLFLSLSRKEKSITDASEAIIKIFESNEEIDSLLILILKTLSFIISSRPNSQIRLDFSNILQTMSSKKPTEDMHLLFYLLLQNQKANFCDLFRMNHGTDYLAERISQFFELNAFEQWRTEIFSLSRASQATDFDKEFSHILLGDQFSFENDWVLNLLCLLTFSIPNPTPSDLFSLAQTVSSDKESIDLLILLLFQGKFSDFCLKVYKITGDLSFSVFSVLLIYFSSLDSQSVVDDNSEIESCLNVLIRNYSYKLFSQPEYQDFAIFYLSLTKKNRQVLDCLQLSSDSQFYTPQKFDCTITDEIE